jgi:hypothetical protein
MLKFGETEIANIKDSLNYYPKNEFDSPYRSTIVLLEYYYQIIQNTNNLFDVETGNDTQYILEYTYKPTELKSRPSCTDLMILGDNFCMAIEAKRCEGEYETVKHWLNSGILANRLKVLDLWLLIINQNIGSNLNNDDILKLPYQMIHRVASACSCEKKFIHVVYLGFDVTDEMKRYYEKIIKDFKKLITDKAMSKFSMVFKSISLVKTDAAKELEGIWDNEESSNLTNEVKDLLFQNKLYKFV